MRGGREDLTVYLPLVRGSYTLKGTGELLTRGVWKGRCSRLKQQWYNTHSMSNHITTEPNSTDVKTLSASQQSDNLTLEELLSDYRDIHLMLNAQWPIESTNERVFARTLKLVEEMGELSNEILTKMGLQRQEKIDAFEQHHLEDEFADVLGSLLLMGIEMDVDVAQVMKRKIAFTLERLQEEIETQ